MKQNYLFLLFILLALQLPSCSKAVQNDSDTLHQKKTREAIRSKILEYVKPDKPGFSIIVSRDGEIIFMEAFGLANVEQKVVSKPETVYKIGSISKQFTAASIMILEERGLISLNDTLGKLYDKLPIGLNGISIKQLLNHSSGLRNHLEIPTWEMQIRESISKERLIETFINEPLYFEPGEGYHYSNSAYVLLGDIIERISGVSYEEFITENIFKPLDLRSSYVANDSIIIPQMASGYRVEGQNLLKAEYMSMSHTYASGSIISNVSDLAKWISGLEKNIIISSESLDKCFRLGLGWFIGKLDGKKMLYHGGGVYGFVSHSAYIPSERLYVAILSNCVDPHPLIQKHMLGDMIMEIAMGYNIISTEKNEKPERVNMTNEQLIKYVGVYRFETGGKRKIVIDNEKVFYEIPPMKKGNDWLRNEIIPACDTLFFSEGKKSFITFQFDKVNNVIGLTVNQPRGKKIKLIKE